MKDQITILKNIKITNIEVQTKRLEELDTKLSIKALESTVKFPKIQPTKTFNLEIKAENDSEFKIQTAEVVTINQSPRKSSFSTLKRRIAVSLKFNGTPSLFSRFKSRGRVTTNFSYYKLEKPVSRVIIRNGKHLEYEPPEECSSEEVKPVIQLRVPYLYEKTYREVAKMIKTAKLCKTVKKQLPYRKVVLHPTENLDYKFDGHEKQKQILKQLQLKIKQFRNEKKLIISRYHDVEYNKQKAELRKIEIKNFQTEKRIEKKQKNAEKAYKKLDKKREQVRQNLDKQYAKLNSKKANLQYKYDIYHQKLDQYYNAVDNLRKKKKELNPTADSRKLYQQSLAGEGNQTNGKPVKTNEYECDDNEISDEDYFE
jgi:hypothetical protein